MISVEGLELRGMETEMGDVGDDMKTEMDGWMDEEDGDEGMDEG